MLAADVFRLKPNDIHHLHLRLCILLFACEFRRRAATACRGVAAWCGRTTEELVGIVEDPSVWHFCRDSLTASRLMSELLSVFGSLLRHWVRRVCFRPRLCVCLTHSYLILSYPIPSYPILFQRSLGKRGPHVGMSLRMTRVVALILIVPSSSAGYERANIRMVGNDKISVPSSAVNCRADPGSVCARPVAIT